MLVVDIHHIHEYIAPAHAGLPNLLLAHSLGSFMTQHYISEHGDQLAGVALSGTSGRPPAIAQPGSCWQISSAGVPARTAKARSTSQDVLRGFEPLVRAGPHALRLAIPR